MKYYKPLALTIIGTVGIVTILGSTTVPKQWTATGGSRADGTVKLSYEIGEYETAQLDESQAYLVASDRCKAWGYTGATPFGGITRQCNNSSRYGCLQWIVSKEFQCTGFQEHDDKSAKKKTAK